jgi:hypothetical protein
MLQGLSTIVSRMDNMGVGREAGCDFTEEWACSY